MKHLIGKQRIDLQVAPDLEASEIQDQVSKLYWQGFVPVLEKVFDRFDKPEEVLEIDRLEINLGQLQASELRAEIVIPLLEQALEKWFQQNKVGEIKGITRPFRQSLFTKWIFFLEKGYLPWNLESLPENWTEQLIKTLTLHPASQKTLAITLSRKPIALLRFIRQHESEFLQEVIDCYHEAPKLALSAILKKLSPKKEKEPFLSFTIRSIVSKGRKFEREAELLDAYYSTEQTIALQTSKNRGEGLVDKPTEIPQEDTFLYIQHAGIILLHPFLLRFFEKLNFVENQEFTQVSRAIHVLHYLASGKKNPFEFDTALLKFLCGQVFNWPIERMIELTEAEVEEADALLEAVLEHWGALGSASIDSLREGFLQRAGKLSYRGGTWTLVMEKNTIDILLNQLPWTVSIIKLPWMKEFLKIEWI